MTKKIMSVILSISMLLGMVSFVNVFAATSEFAKLDLSGYNESSYYSKDGANMRACYTSVDGVKCIAIGKRNTEFITSDGYSHQINNNVSFSNTSGLPQGSAGIVATTTFQLTNKSDHVYMTTTSGIRYLSLYNGDVRTCNASNAAVATGLTYEANKWYTLKLSLNYTTGYYIVELTDLAAGTTQSAKGTRTEWILDADAVTAVQKFTWAKESASGNVYFSQFVAQSESDSDAIAPPPPSRMVIRDDFDSYTSTVSAPWTSSTSVETTERGKSAVFGSSSGTSMTVSNTEGILNSAAKGLVVEFSAKLTYTSTKPNFVVSVNGNWYSAANKIMQFMNNANGVLRDGSNNKILSSWSKDKWYDVRIEISFNEAGNASYRYIVSDGTNEVVKVFEDVSTTLFNTPSAITKIQFTYATGDGKAYVDNVNVYWLDSASAAGIATSYAVNPVDITLENYAEGTDAITTDMNDCSTPFSRYSGNADFAIESVENSGRGKSLKITTKDAGGFAFYKDFAAIQNGSVSFDIMLPTISGQNDGITIIYAQMGTATGEGDSKTKALLRFDNWGNIKDSGNSSIYGSYEAKKWYKLIITAGSNADSGEGQVSFKVVDNNGVVKAEDAVSYGSYNNGNSIIPLDSIKYARVDVLQNPDTIYIDNYKAYKLALNPYGIYPVNQSALKESVIPEETKLTLPFSKPVDLDKSVFKINGEEVSASGYEIITLGKKTKAGEKYEVEYTVYDFDGFKTEGYISGISCVGLYTVEEFTGATLANPAATATVNVSSAAGKKEVKLFVAAYNGEEMIALKVDSKTLSGGETGTFGASVDASGADVVKTFLWDGTTLTPIR